MPIPTRIKGDNKSLYKRCIKGIKPCRAPHQKDGWDHKETGDEDFEQCVAASIHTTIGLDICGRIEFLQVSLIE